MHKLIEEKIAEMNEAIERIKLLEDDIAMAEYLAPDKRVWLDSDVNISWSAKSMDEVKSLLKLFAKEGILLDRNNSNTVPTVWWLAGKSCKICLLPTWSTEEGSTCRLVKVDEVTIISPVFKLICDGKEISND